MKENRNFDSAALHLSVAVATRTERFRHKTEKRNFDFADAPSQSWLSPHHQKASASEPENFDSAALHLSRGCRHIKKKAFSRYQINLNS